MNDFILDKRKLEEMCLTVYNASLERRDIFREGLGKFLPQFTIPEKFHRPDCYLFTMASLERKSQTRLNIRNSQKIASQKDKIWIFYPEQVIENSLENLTKIFIEDFQYTMNDFPLNYYLNCERIVREYDSSPKNIVDTRNVEQAREELMKFKGIGTGIANLFIIYLLDTKLAIIQDPENALLKVDVHKGRLPLNVEAIIPNNSEIRRDKIVNVLERAYLEICRENKIDPCILDASLWIIGSEICAKKDYRICAKNCPLSKKLCIANTPEDENTGRYKIRDAGGKRIETRRNTQFKKQLNLF